MKIDIKSIVNTLASDASESRNTSGTVNIREALGETEKEVQPEKPEQEAPQEETVTEEGAREEAEADVEESPEVVEEAESPVEETPEHDAAEPELEEADETVEENEAEATVAIEEEALEEEEPEEEPEEIEASELEEAEETPEAEKEEDEAAIDESEKGESTQTPAPFKEKLMAWGGKYGWLTGIAASFFILIAFMVVYTTMTPREITAVIDGEERTFVTKEYTVEGFLKDEGIEFCEEDSLSVPLTAFIHEGISFELKHAIDFIVTADGKIKKYKTLDSTVQQALDDAGIEVGEIDIVEPGPETVLEKNMHIIVKRVEIKEEVVEEKVAFETVEKDDVTMNEGTSKVVTEGKHGKDKVTYEIKYIDGVETSRKEIKRETITEAVDKVIANGTRVNYNGQTYSRKLVVKAYSYTGGGTTAMGTRARVGEIAVDPSVIPLGTNVYIEGVGPRRAEDTGGNIKGNTIDIYMDTHAECINWGVRYVTIYVE